MPSLSTTKSEPVVTPDPADLAKNMVTRMEKKIRNLEKRKGKLEDYKEKQAKGQELNEEQLKAIADLSAVLSQIDLLQDLIKQLSTQSAEAQKQLKKRVKKEKFEQAEREKKRLTEVLMLQSVLNNLGDDTIREQFSSGNEGTVKLETAELDSLDELYKLLNPERSTTESVVEQMKCAADHLQAVLDGRDKAVSGTTYRELNDLITKIQDCPFFTEAKPTAEEPEVDDGATEKEYVVVQSEEVPAADSEEVQAMLPPEVPPEPEIPSTTQEEAYQPAAEMHQHPPQQSSTKSFEQIVGNVQGRFNFIQDSEIDIDSPHVDPAVVSVHQMPTHFQNPPQITQPPPDNSMYAPHTHSDSQYQQYMHAQTNSTTATFQHNSAPATTDTDVGMMPAVSGANQPASETYTNSMFSQQNAETQHISPSEQVTEHSSSPPADDFQNRSGNMRQGGYRGRSRGGGGGNYPNGYNSRGGGYRSGGDRGGYKGDKTSGNGFGDQRRGRGGGPRGGYRGGPPNRGGRGGGGRYRGQNQQPHTQQ